MKAQTLAPTSFGRPPAPALRPARHWPHPSRPSRSVTIVGIVAVLVAAAVSAALLDSDGGTDVLDRLRQVTLGAAHLRWQYGAIVLALSALYFVASAVATRAAAGIALPVGETMLVQLSAAAANRVTPAGLGGAGVNVRYLTRRGLHLPAALGAIAALSVLGAVADLLLLIGVVLAGWSVGLGGGAHEIAQLAGHVAALLAPLRSVWLWTAVAVLGVALAGWLLLRPPSHPREWLRFWAPARSLLSRPRALATLLVSSGATTFVIGLAFVASAAMVPGARPAAPIGALLVAYMLAAAAGSSVPTPGGLGSTDAALVAVLLSVRVPAAQAIEAVLVFRLITFWLPAVVGVFVSRHLYRSHAL